MTLSVMMMADDSIFVRAQIEDDHKIKEYTCLF